MIRWLLAKYYAWCYAPRDLERFLVFCQLRGIRLCDWGGPAPHQEWAPITPTQLAAVLEAFRRSRR